MPVFLDKRLKLRLECGRFMNPQLTFGIRLGLFYALIFGIARQLPAAIIGTNMPARSLTVERIEVLPAPARSAWKQFLERSNRQLQTDQSLLRAEMRRQDMKQSVIPPSGYHTRSVPLNRPAAWYGEPEGRRIADMVVSFQTPAGGWSKNLDMSQHARARGEGFAHDSR